MSDYAPDLMRALSAAGCYLDHNGKGDHQIWFSPITDRRFTVDAKIKSRHTANAVLKQAGLQKQFQAASRFLPKASNPRCRILQQPLAIVQAAKEFAQ